MRGSDQVPFTFNLLQAPQQAARGERSCATTCPTPWATSIAVIGIQAVRSVYGERATGPQCPKPRLALSVIEHTRWPTGEFGGVCHCSHPARVEYSPLLMIKKQFGFQEIRLQGMTKSKSKMNILTALTNLFLARRQLLPAS